jgi:hypothetical protein
MEQAIEVIHHLREQRLIRDYAIGGATALMFYTEPALTYDVDIFILTENEPSELVSLTPLYEALKAMGYLPRGEQVLIAGVPVQFIVAYNPLVVEAVQQAQVHQLGELEVRVMTPEHLVAIALQTGRPKDRERVRLLLESGAVARERLLPILQRHGLQERWQFFRGR